MAKINWKEPVTEQEIRDYLDNAQFGYEAPDNRVYTRHVQWLLNERNRLQGELAAIHLRLEEPSLEQDLKGH